MREAGRDGAKRRSTSRSFLFEESASGLPSRAPISGSSLSILMHGWYAHGNLNGDAASVGAPALNHVLNARTNIRAQPEFREHLGKPPGASRA